MSCPLPDPDPVEKLLAWVQDLGFRVLGGMRDWMLKFLMCGLNFQESGTNEVQGQTVSVQNEEASTTTGSFNLSVPP